MRFRARRLGLVALLTVGSFSAAAAGDRPHIDGRHHGHGGGYGTPNALGYGVSYRFADEAIGGDYVGAPFTRFPRPREIVPPAWGYGTFGVPTVAGIRDAPAAAPTLTIISGAEPAPGHRGKGPRILSRGSGGQWTDTGTMPGGPRIVTVTVPRR